MSLRLCFRAALAGIAFAGGAAAQPNATPPPTAVETLAANLKFPWSLAFAPNGDILIVEKTGGLRIYRNGALLPGEVPGGPANVFVNADSGLHDIAIDPDFASNQTVFIAFAEGDEGANRLAVWKARLSGDGLTGGRVIFRTASEKEGSGHPGGRIAFLPDKTFLLTIGDGYAYRDAAQDLKSHLGKTLRLDRNGQAVSDNPFYARNDARREIWSYGHRNAQGLVVDPETGEVWEHEHGPRGGDEINLIVKSANYGWPLTTNGIDYDGTLISERAHAPWIASPLLVWAPSIAPSGLAIYRGDKFPGWNGQLLIGALAAKALVRAERGKDGKFLERERLSFGARIRDVRAGPDGYIYLLTDEADGRLLRIKPGAD